MIFGADSLHLSSTTRIIAVVVTALAFGLVLELVRRRRLVERYALLWMFLSLALLVLAVWNQLLSWLTHDVFHFKTPSNFLFAAAFGVVFILLLHFSVAISRLSEESKMLAQDVARLDHELRRARNGAANGNGAHSADEGASEMPDRERATGESRPI